MKYKKVVIDIETTGLSSTYDEILQISIIDQNGNILINEYCKPKVIDARKGTCNMKRLAYNYELDRYGGINDRFNKLQKRIIKY